MKKNKCLWNWDNDQYLWEALCGYLFKFIERYDYPEDFKYCPHCGKLIKWGETE